jgi:hypothetical protein
LTRQSRLVSGSFSEINGVELVFFSFCVVRSLSKFQAQVDVTSATLTITSTGNFEGDTTHDTSLHNGFTSLAFSEPGSAFQVLELKVDLLLFSRKHPKGVLRSEG